MTSPTGIPPPSARGAWYMGIDRGGTFTDLVMANARNEVHVFKAPSVPADPAAGVLAALRARDGPSLCFSRMAMSNR